MERMVNNELWAAKKILTGDGGIEKSLKRWLELDTQEKSSVFSLSYHILI